MKKRSILYVILILIFLFCVGCKDKNNEIGDSSNGKYIIENPTITEDDYWGQDMFPNMTIETTGENVSALMEKEEYELSDKSISVSLESSKKGTGFYFYGIPAIERLEDNKWVRLGYNEADPSREQWCICAIEDAADMSFSTRLTVDIDNISDELTEGQYRVVVFLTDRTLYVPFNVTGGKE